MDYEVACSTVRYSSRPPAPRLPGRVGAKWGEMEQLWGQVVASYTIALYCRRTRDGLPITVITGLVLVLRTSLIVSRVQWYVLCWININNVTEITTTNIIKAKVTLSVCL